MRVWKDYLVGTCLLGKSDVGIVVCCNDLDFSGALM